MRCENCIHYNSCKHLIVKEHEILLPCKHYKDKNKLIELPCNVGDKVYRKGRFSDKIIETFIDCITIDRFGIAFKARSLTSEFIFNDDEIGNKIYLTKAEAEQALKGGADDE